MLRSHDTTSSASGDPASPWFARGWHSARGGLRLLFWTWLASVVLLVLQLLDRGSIQTVGGVVAGVPTHWASSPFVREGVAYGLLVIGALTAISVARVATGPREAGSGPGALGAFVAFAGALVLALTAAPVARGVLEGISGPLPEAALLEAGAALASVVGCALLLLALDHIARVLETRRRGALVGLIAMLLVARAVAVVVPFVAPGIVVSPVALTGLSVAVTLAFLPLVGGLARTLALAPSLAAPDHHGELRRTFIGRVEPDTWMNVSGGLDLFAWSLRARLVLLVVGSGAALLSLAPRFAAAQPLLAFVVPLLGSALGIAMAVGIDRFARLPSAMHARVAARMALALVVLGAISDGAVALYVAAHHVAPSSPPPATRLFMQLGEVAPMVGLFMLLVAYHRVAVALDSTALVRRVRGGITWYVVATAFAFAARLWLFTDDLALPARLVLGAVALAFSAAALGRHLGATRSLQAPVVDLAEGITPERARALSPGSGSSTSRASQRTARLVPSRSMSRECSRAPNCHTDPTQCGGARHNATSKLRQPRFDFGVEGDDVTRHDGCSLVGAPSSRASTYGPHFVRPVRLTDFVPRAPGSVFPRGAKRCPV